jgi:hypothetical protein
MSFHNHDEEIIKRVNKDSEAIKATRTRIAKRLDKKISQNLHEKMKDWAIDVVDALKAKDKSDDEIIAILTAAIDHKIETE